MRGAKSSRDRLSFGHDEVRAELELTRRGLNHPLLSMWLMVPRACPATTLFHSFFNCARNELLAVAHAGSNAA